MSQSSVYKRAELYDLLLPIAQTDSPEVAFYRELSGGRPTLELGCGSGRLTIPLALSGVEISGLDLSSEMLERARARAADFDLELRWVHADMCTFSVDPKFGLVFAAFNSLLHLHRRTQYESLLERVRAHLVPGGQFAFHIFNPSPKILARDPNERFPFMEPAFDPKSRRILTVEETTRYDSVTQTNGTRLYFSWTDEPDFFETPLNLRVLYPQEVEAILHYNGFEIESTYGEFDYTPFSSASQGQIVVARPRRDSK